MNWSSDLLQTHNYKTNSNFQCVGLTSNPFWVCHYYKLHEPLPAPTHRRSRRSPWLLTFKLWHCFAISDVNSYTNKEVDTSESMFLSSVGCVTCPYVCRSIFLLKRGYVSVVSTTNLFQWAYWTPLLPILSYVVFISLYFAIFMFLNVMCEHRQWMIVHR